MNNPEYVKIKDKKYKINTDFRIGLECDKISRDSNISDEEKALAIIYKLYGDEGLNNAQDWEQLMVLGQKYLNLNREPDEDDILEEPDMDLNEDFDYIEASFMSDYRIDLSEIKMHWWAFIKLINGLSNSEMGNCCILNRIRNLRNMDLSEIKDEKERNKIKKAKEKVKLHTNVKPLTKEQKESQSAIFEALGIGRK